MPPIRRAAAPENPSNADEEAGHEISSQLGVPFFGMVCWYSMIFN
jgi:hypothetical protein